VIFASAAEQAKNRRRGFGRLATALIFALPLLALSFTSCAKRESDAERNAEIDRRVDERLRAEHYAAQEEHLAQRQAALATREKLLAAQEASFANLNASTALTSDSIPADTAADLSAQPYADSYAGYPQAIYSQPNNIPYPDDYGYDYGSDFLDSPYCYLPTTSFITVITQNARTFQPRRNRTAPRFRPPNVTQRQPNLGFRPGAHHRPGPATRVMSDGPGRSIGQPPVRTGGGNQVVNRRRPAKPVLRGQP
jgi:hypothetical protein